MMGLPFTPCGWLPVAFAAVHSSVQQPATLDVDRACAAACAVLEIPAVLGSDGRIATNMIDLVDYYPTQQHAPTTLTIEVIT